MSVHATATKSSRINLRLTPAQEEKLRYVASTTQTSLSDFVLASALERADQVLEDRTEFVATDEDFERLLEARCSTRPAGWRAMTSAAISRVETTNWIPGFTAMRGKTSGPTTR